MLLSFGAVPDVYPKEINSWISFYPGSSSARSLTTISAPFFFNSGASPCRSTPTTRPKLPLRPAWTPTIASSITMARLGSTSNNSAALRKAAGSGLLGRDKVSATLPSTWTSNRSTIPAAIRISSQFLLAETTAVRIFFQQIAHQCD